MSIHVAHAYINLEITRLARSGTPAADKTYIMGLIDMAVMLGHLPHEDAEAYRDTVDRKAGNRNAELRNAT